MQRSVVDSARRVIRSRRTLRVISVVLIPLVTLLVAGCEQADDVVGVNPADDAPETIDGIARQFVDAREEYLTNGDVESGTDAPASWWYGGLRHDNFEFGWSSDFSVSGSHSVMVSRQDSNDGEFGFWAQTVEVGNLAGTRLTLKASVKLENVTGNGVSIVIRGDDTSVPEGMAEAFSSTQRYTRIDGTHDWTTVEVSLDQFPDDIHSVTVYLILLGGSGTVYFDDVTLSSVEAPTDYRLRDGAIDDNQAFSGAWWYSGLETQHYTFARTTDFARSPSSSLQISNETVVDSTFGYWAQTIRADSLVGKEITLTAWVRLRDVRGQGIALALRGDDTVLPSGIAEVFATTQEAVEITGTTGWTAFSVTLPAVPPEIQSVTVYLIHLPNTTGTVYLDDIVLEPTS